VSNDCDMICDSQRFEASHGLLQNVTLLVGGKAFSKNKMSIGRGIPLRVPRFCVRPEPKGTRKGRLLLGAYWILISSRVPNHSASRVNTLLVICCTSGSRSNP
jgi:hypothetical protein